MDKKLLLKTFRNVSGAAVYIFLVSQVMSHGEKWFGREDNAFTPVAVLLLFSLSAATVGGLVFGESVLMIFQKKYTEAVKAAIYSVSWLAGYTFIALLSLYLLNVAK